tara:strand:+ start:135 stop:383 length:249 start_codon:yes stop_codon:yes gene_type:complete
VGKPEQHLEKQEQKNATSKQEAAVQLDSNVISKLINQIVLDRSDGLRDESVELVSTIIMELFNKELDKLEEQLEQDRVDRDQ